VANKRFYQVFAKREEIPGLLESTLIAAGNAVPVFKDPQLTYDIETFEREVQFASLSPLKSMFGGVQGSFSFGLELAGTSTSGAAPGSFLFLEACGMRLAEFYGAAFTNGAATPVAGAFGGSAGGALKYLAHGDLLQTASAAKVVRVVHDTYEGQTTVYYEQITGGNLAGGDVLWPSTSDATVGPLITIVTGSLGTTRGWCLSPISNPVISMTAGTVGGTHSADQVYLGATSKAVIQGLQVVTAAAAQRFRLLDGTLAATEVFNSISGVAANFTSSVLAQAEFPSLSMGLIEDGRVKQMRGCRGTCSISAERGKPAILNFTFKGLVSPVVDGGPLSGITSTQRVPPRFFGTNLGLLLGSYKSGEPGYFSHTTAHTPAITALTLDLGGSTNLQEDATQATGYTGTGQPGPRASQGSMAVEVRPEARFPFIGKLTSNESFWLKMQIRDPGIGNNNFLISAPGITGTGSSPGEQNGFGRDDYAFGLSALTPAQTDGTHRELVISYHYSGPGTW